MWSGTELCIGSLAWWMTAPPRALRAPRPQVRHPGQGRGSQALMEPWQWEERPRCVAQDVSKPLAAFSLELELCPFILPAVCLWR